MKIEDGLSNPNFHILLHYIGHRHFYLLAYLVNYFIVAFYIIPNPFEGIVENSMTITVP